MDEEQSKFSDACINGEMDIIDSMLDEGFNPNYSQYLTTPLQQVCISSEPWVVDVVTKLITHGANVDMECDNGWNASSFCLFAHPFQPHVAQLLLDCSKLGVNRLDSKGRNYFHHANTIEAYKFLIDNGIEVNNIDSDGCTTLDRTDP